MQKHRLLSYFSTPNPWQNRGNRRPSSSSHVLREYFLPNKPYWRGCFVLLLLNIISQCLGHLACVLMVSLMNGQQETLVETKQKGNLLKPERKKKCHLCLVSPLTERGKRQLLAPCWRFMFCVEWCMTSLIHCASGWWRCWVLLWCETAKYFL